MAPSDNRVFLLSSSPKIDRSRTLAAGRVLHWGQDFYWEGPINDRNSRGGEPYFCPNGWSKLGVRFEETASDFNNVYANWPIAYHATKFDYSMLSVFPGLKAANAGIRKTAMYGSGVYLSPSVDYITDGRRAPAVQLRMSDIDEETRARLRLSPEVFAFLSANDAKWIQVAYQLKVKPRSFSKHPITGAFHRPFADPRFDNSQIEWLVDAPAGTMLGPDKLLVYGIMYKISDTPPN
jgi:hypothetical protein